MNILIFLAVLVVLVVVHELGHFIVAKRFGIRVDEFGIGFPPRAFTFWKKGDTSYTLNWLPFGGFVKILGEDPEDPEAEGVDQQRSLTHKSKLVQASVLVAGVGMNILLAWALFSVSFISSGVPVSLLGNETVNNSANVSVIVSQVLPNSPAEEAGIESGDIILSVSSSGSGKKVNILTPEEITSFIRSNKANELKVSIRRGEQISDIKMKAQKGLVGGSVDYYAIGVGMGLSGEVYLSPISTVFKALEFTGKMFVAIAVAIVGFFVSAITLSADLSQIAGPIGIVGLVGDAASLGIVPLMMFTAFISLNLAVINLLPVPALDGGRLLFVFIEAIKGSPISPSVSRRLNMIGFALLILLMLVVTYSDIARIFVR